MAQDSLVENSNSLYFYLLTLSWGGSVARYINDSRRFTDGAAVVYAALPNFACDLKKQSGGAEDEPISIIMPPVPPLSDMASGVRHADVNVLLEELDVLDESTRRKVFKGTITKITVNKNGRDDQIEATVAGLRGALSMPLGIPALNTCAWNFGDPICGIDLAPLRQTLVCSAVDRNEITFAAADNPPYWFRGYVSYEGLSIMVRDHLTTTKVRLVDNAPPSWEGKTLTFTPGCAKTKEECLRWNNIANFGGIGVAIPSYHPVFEAQ